MSRGLEDLLSHLVCEKERCQKLARKYEYPCMDWRNLVHQEKTLDEKIERVLTLLEK